MSQLDTRPVSREGTEVDQRTAELYSEQVNIDTSEPVVTGVIDAVLVVVVFFRKRASILPELQAGMKETLQETTKHVMIR